MIDESEEEEEEEVFADTVADEGMHEQLHDIGH